MVLRNRTRTVFEEWEADAEALASEPVRVPAGLTVEEVTRRRKPDAASRLARGIARVECARLGRIH